MIAVGYLVSDICNLEANNFGCKTFQDENFKMIQFYLRGNLHLDLQMSTTDHVET